jgi:hypothetical protein
LSNPGVGFTFNGVPGPDNCISFEQARGRSGRARNVQAPRGAKARADNVAEIFDHLSPAQYAFLSGVLAILAEHGEEALTRSCEMVIERFGRGRAG